MTCDRCHKETYVRHGSYFNTEMVCGTCLDTEEAHPDFERARQAEEAEVKRGNFNFPGIGKPHDL